MCSRSFHEPDVMRQLWDTYDDAVAATPMPPEYADLKVRAAARPEPGRPAAPHRRQLLGPPARPGGPAGCAAAAISEGAAAHAPPPPHLPPQVSVLCNDCTPSVRSSTPFHVVGHKCDVCGGYNTQRV
jgi:hypothetical protein